MELREIDYKDLKINPMTMFGDDWGLVAAGNEQNGYNAMTIAWGQIGAVWDRATENGKMIIPTASVYIRPQRYTKEFFDREEYFTVSFLKKQYKRALGYMGTHSGKKEEKIVNAGLTPLFIGESVGFEEAGMIFVCKKIYHAPLLESGFVDQRIIPYNYPERDFHEMYIGEIVTVYTRE